MNAKSYTAVRSHFAKTMQQVCQDHVPLLITRSKAESVVMLSLSDFEAMQESCYLLKSPANAHRLLEAMDEIEELISKQSS